MISSRRGAGHVGPLIPFAKAFLRDNDEVVVGGPELIVVCGACVSTVHVREAGLPSKFPAASRARTSTVWVASESWV